MEGLELIDFKSSKETERQRQWEKKARQDILDRAKNDYDRRQAKEEAARQRGETTWMLPSVEAKLGSEKSSKKKKKKEKKKKKKKSKKSKKHDSSSSSSDSDEEESWVERSSSATDTNGSSSQPVKDHRSSNNTEQQQQTTRDGWMEMTSLFGTYTKEEMNIRDGTSRKAAKEEEERKKKEKEKLGSHALELNPYYKNGGSGLPEEQQKPSDKTSVVKSSSSSSSTFDAQWLRRALKRAEEQAKEQGKSLEEVAAHRWGSLEKFYELLDEAEGKGKSSKDIAKPRNRSRDRDGGGKYNDKISNNRERRNRSRERSTSRDRKRHRSRSRDRKRYGRSRGKERKQYSRSRSRSRERKRSKERSDRRNKNRSDRSSSGSSSRSRSKSKERKRSRSRSREKYSSGRSERRGLGLMKPSDDQDSTRPRSMFKKPEDDNTESSKWRASMTHSTTQNRGWQKKEFQPQKKIQRSSSSSSSSSSSDSDDEKKSAKDCEVSVSTEVKITEPETELEKPSAPTPVFLNDKQMNELAAKIMKAEMLGNDAQVEKLKKKMESARAARASGPSVSSGGENTSKREEEIVLLTKTDSKGNVRPVSSVDSESYNKKKRNKVKTHGKDGNRDRYFPDDDKYNLKSMFEKEKGTSAEEQNSLYERAIAKNHERLDDDYDVDDMFLDKATQREGDTAKQMEMEQKKAIKEHQRTQRSLENCQWCFDSKESLKHLIVALGSKAYLSLPAHESLTPGHCIIVPIQHTSCTVQADEDIWNDVQSFRKSLVRLFESRGEDCIFFEMARGFRNLPHMTIHCIPLPKETGDMAPIYFKKAIMECEGEWAQNKKLVELKGRDVRRAIPKGLPYFFVDFAMMDGYAHVIEDEQTFPRYFAQEIIGGMLDVETNLWRKPRRENFDAQRRKVMQFSTWYKEFDPTQNG